MSPKSNEDLPSQYIFVGGTTLKSRGIIRSSLLRRAFSDKRVERHRDAAEKLEFMIKQGESASSTCSCVRDIAGTLESAPGSGKAALQIYRPIRPKGGQCKTSESRGLPQYYSCSICGRSRLSTTSTSAIGPWCANPPLQSFASGNLDPLIPFDPQLAGVKVQELLNLACTAIWPHFRSLDYTSACYKTLVFPFEDKLKVYAVLWSTSYHRDMLRVTMGGGCSYPPDQVDSKEQLYLKALVLRCLREEVSNVSHLTSPDGLVMSVLYLAVNVAHRTGTNRDSNPFSPPFVDLHALHIYGSRRYHPWHWAIVHNIIRQFGGIGSLKGFALAWLVSLADLMNAVNTFSKPIYPMLDVHGRILDLEPPLYLFPLQSRAGNCCSIHHYEVSSAGLGFHELEMLSPPVKQDVVTVFVHIGQLSRVIQHYSVESCSTSPAVLDLLGDSRNLVHHRFLCLPNEEEDDLNSLFLEEYSDCPGRRRFPIAADVELSREVYLACRLTLFLYAIHVTFPIPRIGHQQKQLVSALRRKLHWLVMERDVSGPLLIWSLIILIVSMGEKEDCAEEWLSHVRRMCLDLGVDSLERLLRLLRSFAWVDSAVPNFQTRIWAVICSRGPLLVPSLNLR